MKNATHKFQHADGRIEQRKSHRTYTHVVIGQRSEVVDRATAIKFARHDCKRDFAYYVKQANPATRSVSPFTSLNSADDIARYEHIASVGLDAWTEECVAAAIARHEKNFSDKMFVLQWSMSPGAAGKGSGRWIKNNWFAVSIQPVTERSE